MDIVESGLSGGQPLPQSSGIGFVGVVILDDPQKSTLSGAFSYAFLRFTK